MKVLKFGGTSVGSVKSVLSLKLIAITNGNPYSTIVLCLQSILNKSKITICPNNVMNGLNSTIVNIIGECCPKTVKPEFLDVK